MKKIIKIILIPIILIVMVLAGLLVFLNSQMGVKTLRPYISQVVEKYTGRELHIDGDLQWKIYPNIMLRVSKVQLSNPKTYVGKQFADIGEVDIAVKLLPLLSGNIEPTKLLFNEVHLTVYEDARSNKHTDIEFDKAQFKGKAQLIHSGLSVNGHFLIHHLITQNLNLYNIDAKLDMDDNIIHFYPVTADAYQGKINTDVTFNVQTNTPVITIKGNMRGIRVEQLLKDMTGDAGISGSADIDVDLKTKGSQQPQFTKNLNGNIGFKISNGTLRALNVLRQVDKAFSIVTGEKQQLHSNGSNGNGTEFVSFDGVIKIINGIANVQAQLKSDVLEASAKGPVNLLNKQMDIDVVATYIKSKKLSIYEVPLKIEGAYDNPKAHIDSAKFGQLLLKFHGKNIEESINKGIKKIPSLLDKLF